MCTMMNLDQDVLGICTICLMPVYICIFVFKQKTAYEMRISDWSSDVCSSDLDEGAGRDDFAGVGRLHALHRAGGGGNRLRRGGRQCAGDCGRGLAGHGDGDRKSTRLNSSH